MVSYPWSAPKGRVWG